MYLISQLVCFCAGFFCTMTACHGFEEKPLRLQIGENTDLDPKIRYAGLEILSSDITIDGKGALISGDILVSPKDRKGVGIQACEIHRVKLKNLKVTGLGTALELIDCSDWIVENCEFSDNASDPDFGWGESPLRGGIYLDKVKDSRIRNCKAQRNWNNCELFHCSNITIEDCDFSVASNNCLSMRASNNNRIQNCNLTHGIRIAPGEVHARDSACLLIEGGCHHNVIRNNDCRFGGDGIFIRAIGSSFSTDNLIEGNDCSYAHNNAIECGSPGNRFIRNKANHSSYGMWMGGSDQTEIVDNEASFNGLRTGHHNSPHLPNNGHAGIVFMFATAEHVLIRGNRCIGNNGAGIALVAHNSPQEGRLIPTNIVLDSNVLVENLWGIFLEDAQLIRIQNNLLLRNRVDSIFQHGSTENTVIANTAIAEYQHQPNRHVSGQINGPKVLRTGESARYAIRLDEAVELVHELQVQWEWTLGGTIVSREPSLDFTPSLVGPQTIAVRATSPELSSTAWINVVLLESACRKEVGNDPAQWQAESEPGLGLKVQRDSSYSIDGDSSICIDVNPYHGTRFLCNLDVGPIDMKEFDFQEARLSFWIDSLITATIGWQDRSPMIIITDSDGRQATFQPKHEILSRMPDNRKVLGWQYVALRLKDPPDWTVHGDAIKDICKISFGFDTWGMAPLKIWIDQISLSGIQNP